MDYLVVFGDLIGVQSFILIKLKLTDLYAFRSKLQYIFRRSQLSKVVSNAVSKEWQDKILE